MLILDITCAVTAAHFITVVSKNNIPEINLHFVVWGSDFIFHSVNRDLTGYVRDALIEKEALYKVCGSISNTMIAYAKKKAHSCH